MSEKFPIKNGLKQGDVLSPWFFNFALEYAIRMVQVNPNGFMVYADDVNILGGSAHTIKKNSDP